jgi:hypothetical protein
MSKSARSVFVFGLYLALLGMILVVVPNFLLKMFFFPGTSEVWIRVVGMLLLILGYYYIRTSRKETIEFFHLTVHVRSVTILFFAAFVLLGFAGPSLILFGVVDLLGALWTGLALRSTKTTQAVD